MTYSQFSWSKVPVISAFKGRGNISRKMYALTGVRDVRIGLVNLRGESVPDAQARMLQG